MEFLRFGSSIPGGYWGCCAFDIIQCFKQDPDEKASISLVNGDGGQPMMKGNEVLFAGKTWREIFQTRLRINTFNTGDKPNHGFLLVLTDWQLANNPGKKWLEILREEGFEFIRTVDNSVYSGASVIDTPGTADKSSHKNYLFGLFRNIGTGAVGNPYTPPKAWTDLEQKVPEAHQFLSKEQQEELTVKNQEYHLTRWEKAGKAKFYTEKELEAEGVPVTYAGVRSRYPEQSKEMRNHLQDEEKKWKEAYSKSQGKSDVANTIFATT